MNKLSSSKAILMRAKSLLTSTKISDLELAELSILMNEYIDFLDDYKNHRHDLDYIENDEKLKEILSAYCDNIETGFVEKKQIRGLR
ncbi:MAG: hypothetical protein IKJ43_01005 [Bacilli bacterium]|nr:hypothetical protein [Bacilli bacterium]